MSLKRTTIMFVGAVALAAWFAAAMTPGRAPVSPAALAALPAGAVDRSGAELAAEIARLRERLTPGPTPREPARNPFAFRSNARSASSARPEPTPAELRAVAAPVGDNLRLQLTLAGVAEDPGPDGVRRTAIISGNGQLALVTAGETVIDRGVTYRVGAVFADSVELTDSRDGTTHRLTLK